MKRYNKLLVLILVVSILVSGIALFSNNPANKIYAEAAPVPTTATYVLSLTGAYVPIDVNPPGISVTGSRQISYPAGTVVTLKANSQVNPNGSGTFFIEWQGDIVSRMNPLSITMTKNITLRPMYAVGDPVITPTPRLITPTPTNPISTATPTMPVRTPTPVRATPTPNPNGTIKVQFYNQSTVVTSNQIYLNIKLINISAAPITLSDVKMRYYYTIDQVKPQNFYCDYSSVGSSNVTGVFVTMAIPKTGADTYAEIGFTSGAGNLASGANVTVQARVARNDWTSYNQANDYSFNATGTTYLDWAKITGYVAGILQWGIEP